MRGAFVTCLLAVLIAACGRSSASRRPPQWTEPVTGMVFVSIPAGEFRMGSAAGEAGRESQERQHSVTLSKSFWLGAFEVTQQQWQRVMGTNPSAFHGDATLPVENVTWLEVRQFVERLDRVSPGNHFRLPTEAEWEFACRAGSTSAYGTGSSLAAADANFAATPASASSGHTLPVGSFPPNAWGLHDMSGNVWEWTEDEHCPYGADAAIDPVGQCGSPLKVIRGGSWYFGADSARCGLRYTHRPQDRGFSLGFRVVRE